jgi:hypothetical protein
MGGRYPPPPSLLGGGVDPLRKNNREGGGGLYFQKNTVRIFNLFRVRVLQKKLSTIAGCFIHCFFRTRSWQTRIWHVPLKNPGRHRITRLGSGKKSRYLAERKKKAIKKPENKKSLDILYPDLFLAASLVRCTNQIFLILE